MSLVWWAMKFPIEHLLKQIWTFISASQTQRSGNYLHLIGKKEKYTAREICKWQQDIFTLIVITSDFCILRKRFHVFTAGWAMRGHQTEVSHRRDSMHQTVKIKQSLQGKFITSPKNILHLFIHFILSTPENNPCRVWWLSEWREQCYSNLNYSQ